MKTLSADLMAVFASKQAIRVNLFKIGPMQNGAMIYACDGSGAITFGGNVYDPVAFGDWSRGSITTKIGLESNSTTLTVFADNYTPVDFPGTSGAAQLLDGLKMGLADSASVTIYTAYMKTYGVVVGPTGGSLVETKFIGEIGDIKPIGYTKAEITVNDLLYLLNAQTPQMLLQASCRWTLYGAGCTLSAASFSRSGAVGTVLNSLSLNPAANLTPHTTAGTFTQGSLTWTSGPNNGLTCHVATWTPGGSGADVILFDVAPLFPMAAGHTFTIYQGCTKTYASCNDLQGATNAALNFGGTPNVPVPESAI